MLVGSILETLTVLGLNYLLVHAVIKNKYSKAYGVELHLMEREQNKNKKRKTPQVHCSLGMQFLPSLLDMPDSLADNIDGMGSGVTSGRIF